MTIYSYGQAEPIVQKLIELLPPQSEILDIGCGEGRNTLPLARHGMRVEGWDKDLKEIDNLQKLAGQEQLPIKVVPCDMRDFRIGYDRWNAILTILCLHYLRPEDAIERLLRVRLALIPGGYHALVVFTKDGDLARQRDDRFYPPLHELKKHYASWEIITEKIDSVRCLQKGPQGQTLINECLTLLARKPL